MKEIDPKDRVKKVLELLELHHDSFSKAVEIARRTGHPVPVDSRGWSQIIVSVLTGIKGLERKKGADLVDGSEVKAANTWEAIDTPRFNGVLKAGTKASASGKIESLGSMPYLFFVLWDLVTLPSNATARCRIWVVRPRVDPLFRKICSRWYKKRDSKEISSDNFQLHPPRGKESNVFRNTCGNLSYPLLFRADRPQDSVYQLKCFDPSVLKKGLCEPAQE